MPSTLSEDEIDDLLYFARIGDIDEFNTLKDQLCQREGVAVLQLLQCARDEGSGNGILHMAAANGHAGRAFIYRADFWRKITLIKANRSSF